MQQTEQRGSMSSEISRRAVQVLADFTGRGPNRAHTMINRNMITVLFAETLTKGERRLAGMGMGEHVLDTRHKYQQAMRADLVSVVEEVSERKVVAFMSDNHIEPDLAVEVFVLAGGLAPSAEDEGDADHGYQRDGRPDQ